MNKQSGRKQKRKTGGKAQAVCRITGTVLIIAVILLCVPLVAPQLFGWHMYHVISGSMEPELKIGSLIYIYEDPPEEIKKKDIIVFYSSLEDGGIITHRVVENNPVSGTFLTKGDANEKDDPSPVPYENYIGKVKLAIPCVGKALMLMTSLYGKITAICIVALGVILNLFGSRQKEEVCPDLTEDVKKLK